MKQANLAQSTIAARIDRLPMSWSLWRILLLGGLGWLVESYDIGVIGSVLPLLERQYRLNTFMVGALAVASTIGIVIAIIPAGWLADRLGRKKVLIVGTLWYAVFSILCGIAPSPIILLMLRIVAGFGMGAIFPIPYAMAAELTPQHFRGAMTAILDSFLSVGYFLAPLIAFVLIPRVPEDIGWRYLFFIGGVPLLYVPLVWKWMPESPRWLQSAGQSSEADGIVRGLEADAEYQGVSLPQPDVSDKQTDMDQRVGLREGIAQVFRRPYLQRTTMLAIAFPCILYIFYAIQTYTPTILLKEGNGTSTAFLLTAIIVVASIPGKYAAGYAVERFGRKTTLISFTTIAAISAVCFGLASTVWLALGCGIVLSFFGIGVDPVIKIYSAEQYPTHLRETGVSVVEGIGRLFGGALAPFTMAFVLDTIGVLGSYVFIAIIAIVGVVAVATLGTETVGQSIEQTSGSPALEQSR